MTSETAVIINKILESISFMKQLPLHNTYTLLALFLAPAKSEETLGALKNAIINEQVELGPLLLQANIQMCTPLWYSRLEQDDLLQYLPEDFQQFLQVIYDANAERNTKLKEGLTELLSEFEKEKIETVLLKGGATFMDELYNSLGARYMVDLDILVRKEKLKMCESILEKLQYVEEQDEGRELDDRPTSERHQHINPRIKPGTVMTIEIHFKPAFAHSGRILTNELVWKFKQNVTYNKYKTAILDPDHRIFLNTTHALLPKREFLHGMISLVQLAEFAVLAIRYQDKIDWGKWYQTALDNNLKIEFLTYLLLAHHLMEVPWPKAIPCMKKKGFHYQRIIDNGGALSRVEGLSESKKEKFIRYLGNIYFWVRFPGWVWKNTCYAPRARDFPDRVRLLFKKLFSAKSRAKI